MSGSSVELLVRQAQPGGVAERRLRQEVARLRADNARLRCLAFYDSLTGLPNRQAFGALAARVVAAARPGSGPVGMLLDLNRFKEVNDTWGHEAGDQVLVTIAHRLASHCGAGWLLARLGGDEFAGVRLTAASTRRLVAEAGELFRALSVPLTAAGRVLRVPAAVGVAAPAGPVPFRELLRRADTAMYEAKQRGHPVVSTRYGDGDTDVLPEGSVDMLRVPTVNPPEREQVPAAGSYAAGDPVWVHRHGGWHPGLVRSASAAAVMVDYHRVGERGLLTDTVPALYVMARAEPDPQLDTKAAVP